MKKKIAIGLVLAMLASLAVVGVAGAWGPYQGGYNGGYYGGCGCYQPSYQSCCQPCYQTYCCVQTCYTCYTQQTYYFGPAYNGCGGYGCYGGQQYQHTFYGGNNFYYGYNAGYQHPW
jgi:hypothetical protein